MSSLFRVKPYAHDEYKFVVRAKLDGKWRRRYFRTEQEAISYADEQNRLVNAGTEDAALAAAPDDRDGDLPYTGERLIPGSKHRRLAYEHLHRYAIACDLARGKRVLDIACGEGYGSNLLAAVAADVVGIDVDPASIAHATAEYPRPNLRFVEGDCVAIPLPDHSVDLVASFETIEHLRDHERFLAEICRVLTPNGVLVISSPDRAEYSAVSATPNPFHVAELSHDEFVDLVGGAFQHVVVGKQRLVLGSWIAPDQTVAGVTTATAEGWFDDVNVAAGVRQGLYSIAVCSQAELPPIAFGVFENFRETAHTWDLLDREGNAAEIAMQLSSLGAEADQLKQQNSARAAELAGLRQENAAAAQRIAQLERQQAQRSRRLQVIRQRERSRRAETAALHEQLRGSLLQNAELRQTLTRSEREAAELRRASDTAQHELAASRREIAHLTESASRDSTELADARWAVLTLRSDLLRRKDGASDALTKLGEMEERANSATGERDHLREIVVTMQRDLEQERLNVAALQQRMRLIEERANVAEENVLAAADDRVRRIQQQLYEAEDRVTATEAKLDATGRRAAVSEDQLRTVRSEFAATQEQLRIAGTEVAARREQIKRLRERLSHRLILPFGEAQQRIFELTK